MLHSTYALKRNVHCKLLSIFGPCSVLRLVVLLVAIQILPSRIRFNMAISKVLFFQSILYRSKTCSFLRLDFYQALIHGCPPIPFVLWVFEFSHSLIASLVLVPEIVSGSGENAAQKHFIFDRNLWFCTWWSLSCGLLRTAKAENSDPLNVLERALAFGCLKESSS